MSTTPSLDDAATLLQAADQLLGSVQKRAAEVTENGRQIDAHQVLTERVAYAATEARAAHELMKHTENAQADGLSSETLELCAIAGVAELVRSLHDRLTPALDDLGLGDAALEDAFPRRREPCCVPPQMKK